MTDQEEKPVSDQEQNLVSVIGTTDRDDTGTLEKSRGKEDDNSDDDDYSDGEDDEYSDWFQSIRSPTGLEIGVQVTWPDVRPFSVSTRLDACEIAPMFHGTQWAGTVVWRAAVVALQYLLLFQQAKDNNDDDGNGERNQQVASMIPPIGLDTQVLELGCGLGIPGMLLHEITNCSVVLTDMDSLVDQLRVNLEKNFPAKNEDAPKIQAHALDWSVNGVEKLLEACGRVDQGFDIVLNCDCVYEPLYGREAWQSLIACQRALLQANPNAILITSLERRNADGVGYYLDALHGIAENVEKIIVPFPHATEVEVYVAYGVKKT
mmetsp:Transcript_13099/g.17146  ORF Transcript_13099/g.17146 Transcript_13099/m.17146 type:complete len:320 (-) Transcript_13099:1491-2450(-)|eukprot:CAMPEP_0198144164 /NCGR_PEP_ID=MMETSP1443-20131203/13648_1 /TAXON_ID=186043 /ORGANISM="Entomoneis sp., Strain CCMP2396" /LENGTH=319 /DNA_ID=CAMNT_0043807515 /DNA_START=25 /DNA_END=984 /DNA_ORIENTATION=+